MTTFQADEKTPGVYTATLKDEAGVVVPGSTLGTLTLTLYDVATGAIINARDNQNVKNTNNVTIDESGLITWSVQIADNVIVNPDASLNFTVTNPQGQRVELHNAFFRATWNGGTKAANHLVQIAVVNYDKLT